MTKKLAALAFAAASLGMFAAAPSAQAAHCLEGDSPGFSYFGTDHVQESDHAEGEKVHAGTPAASNCRETSGSPADRAPGQNR